MSNLLPFNEIKLQWLQLLQRDHSLGDCAVRVASEIILTYSNGQTGKAWPSYSTLAEVLGKSIKTIQRAIHEVELAGWFDVKRGNGSGQSTIYIPTEKSIIAACKAREKTDYKTLMISTYFNSKTAGHSINCQCNIRPM